MLQTSGYPSKPRQEVGHETSQRSQRSHRSQVNVHEIPDAIHKSYWTQGPEPDNWSPDKPPQGVGQRLSFRQGHCKGQADWETHSSYVRRGKKAHNRGLTFINNIIFY